MISNQLAVWMLVMAGALSQPDVVRQREAARLPPASEAQGALRLKPAPCLGARGEARAVAAPCRGGEGGSGLW